MAGTLLALMAPHAARAFKFLFGHPKMTRDRHHLTNDIYIALGSNLGSSLGANRDSDLDSGLDFDLDSGRPSNLGGKAPVTPLDNCRQALRYLDQSPSIRVVQSAPWYKSPPEDRSTQPWYINGAAKITTSLNPARLLARLHDIEERMGRVRRRIGESRVIDLDLLDYGGLIHAQAPILPHPRIENRAFVLLPLADIAPHWCHPRSHTPIHDLIDRLAPSPIERMDER